MYPNPQDVLPLPPRPDLEQYKKRAKELVKACKSSQPDALHAFAAKWVASLSRLYGRADTSERWVRHEAAQIEKFSRLRLAPKCSLSAAQFVIARVHGFESWPRFAAHLEALAGANSSISSFEEAAHAIVTGNLPVLQRLLREDSKLILGRSTREHRATLLHYVAANGVENYRQRTPANIIEITRLLLRAGADVNAECDVYGGGATTLGLAATSVHPEQAGVQLPLIQLLLDHGAIIEKPGTSMVISCLANGRRSAAEFLADKGAHLDLEGAAGVGRLDLVKTFFNPDGSLKAGATPEQLARGFGWACEYGRTLAVRFLLEKGFDVTSIPEDSRETGLHWAAFGGHLDLVRVLLEHHAPVDVRDKVHGGTPLGWALYGWANLPADAAGENYYEVVTTLINAGAKVDEGWLEDPERPEGARLKNDRRMQAALLGKFSPG